MAVFYALLRLLAAATTGYAVADLIDHFSKGREARTGEPEPKPTFQNWRWQRRIFRSIRFWLGVVIVSFLGFLFIRQKLKK